MDIHDLWQEHKRFILGVLGGLLAFWIGWLVIGSVWDESAALKRARADVQSVSGELYDDKALTELRDENEKLTQTEQALVKALAFKPRDEFQLEGKGPADLHFDTTNRKMRQRWRALCEDKNVELLDRNLEWAIPTEREDIQSTLLAFDLIDHAVQRLLVAHDAVRKKDPEALGLIAIDKLRVDKQKGSQGYRGAQTKLRIEEVLLEDRVEFALRCDAAVLWLFCEACRSASPPIALADFKFVQGKSAGDPLVATGKLSALQIKAPQAQPQ